MKKINVVGFVVCVVSAMLLAVMLTIAVNVYKESKEINRFEHFVKSSVEMGIGTEGYHTYESSILGQEFEVTYHVDGDGLVKEVNWK